MSTHIRIKFDFTLSLLNKTRIIDIFRIYTHYILSQLTTLEDSPKYWATKGKFTSVKDFLISTTDSQEFLDHCIHTFNVTRTGQVVEKVVKQFQFTSWPEFGTPTDPSGLLTFLRKVNNWKTSTSPTVSSIFISSPNYL